MYISAHTHLMFQFYTLLTRISFFLQQTALLTLNTHATSAATTLTHYICLLKASSRYVLVVYAFTVDQSRARREHTHITLPLGVHCRAKLCMEGTLGRIIMDVGLEVERVENTVAWVACDSWNLSPSGLGVPMWGRLVQRMWSLSSRRRAPSSPSLRQIGWWCWRWASYASDVIWWLHLNKS